MSCSSQTIVSNALIAVVKANVAIAVPGSSIIEPPISSLINAAVTDPVATGPPGTALTATGVAASVELESALPAGVFVLPIRAHLGVSGVVWVVSAAVGTTTA